MELLFFASVGDPERCRVICETWDISVADKACCDYDRRTPLCALWPFHTAAHAAAGCLRMVVLPFDDQSSTTLQRCRAACPPAM